MSEEDKKSLVLSRRSLVRAATVGAAFAVPLMASFSKDGLAINAAAAQGKKAAKKAPAKKAAGKKP
jgi:hypothetical protein